jgi:hypothetical protein
MSDFAASRTPLPDPLPEGLRARRLAITALGHRGVANRRERDLTEFLGDDGYYLISDYVSATTGEVAAQLLLSEQLLAAGWQWPDILRSVWYREEALREAANRE